MPIRVGTGQRTLIDMNDITPSNTAPLNPTENMLWMNTSKSPYVLMIYKGGVWKQEGPTNLFELDPDADQKVEDAWNGIVSLDDDGKLTKFERSIIRGELANIVGKYLNPTDVMPTLATIDGTTHNVGQAYTIRKSARDIGIPTNDTAYANFGAAYTALNTYLSSMSPKGWDVVSTAVNTIVPTAWETAWNNYYLRYNLLNVAIQVRQKDYADQVGDGAVADAIRAVNNSNQFQTVPLTNPANITSPLTSLGLPEFQGRHVDSWTFNGRNMLKNSGEPITTSTYNIKSYPLAETIAEGTQVTVTMKATLGAGKTQFGLYNSGGSLNITNLLPAHRDAATGIFKLTFNWKATGTTNNTLQVYAMQSTVTSESTIEWIMLERGAVAHEYSPEPQEAWGTNGTRIKPITNPAFSSASSLSLYGKFYGDGTNNDTFGWDATGKAIKTKKWEDALLKGDLEWAFHADATGFKQVKVANFAETVVDSTIQGVNSMGALLTTTPTITAAGQVKLVSDLTLVVSLADTETGWGETYTPSAGEISAYFNGWKMCNGTYNVPYNGTGNKVWYPIGDTNLNRSTVQGLEFNGVPTTMSVAITEQSINHYQVVYRIAQPEQETIIFDGILGLVEGANAVTTSYPMGTPEIVTGTIKYAITLATVTDSIKYLIPSIQHRLTKAEEIITEDSIINTVTNSVAYTLAMKNKANASDLGNFATTGELDDLAAGVDGKIGNAIDSIDFTPYVTQSELAQTATNITAKFGATGGMNLIKNSIGFADLNFWTLATAFQVKTVSNNELDTLGFGSGFLFNPDGNNAGITQTVAVVPGQPYTLSWYLNKRTSGSTGAFRFYVQIEENGVIKTQIADNSAMTTVGYESSNFTFTPQASNVVVKFIGYGSVDATLTGIMLTIGDVPLQWSLATGEVYNTNIRMDINGIRVSQLDANRREIGYTQITPEEFAGWYDSDGTGVFKKVFYLNGDETVTKKLRVEDSVVMGKVKIVNVASGGRNGWAFVPNFDV